MDPAVREVFSGETRVMRYFSIGTEVHCIDAMRMPVKKTFHFGPFLRIPDPERHVLAHLTCGNADLLWLKS